MESATRTRLIVTLLTGQTYLLGFSIVGALQVASSVLFLATYGADAMPYVFIITAIFASAFSYGFANLQRRWPLARLVMTTVAVLALFFGMLWIVTLLPNTQWLYPLLVAVYAMMIPLTHILVGGQAGRLLNVREIKRLYPRITSGLIAGSTTAAFCAPLLRRVIARVETLLLVVALGALLALVLMLITVVQFRDALSKPTTTTTERTQKSIGHLLQNRYIALIFTYQMLSAIVSQLVVYLFFIQAGARYTTPEALTNLIGGFQGVRNIISFLFVTLAAGALLNRFGLKLGLIVNPVMVVLMALILSIVGGVYAPGALILLALVMVTFQVDISMMHGMTTTSMKATYQSLPPEDRAAAQIAVEGMGVPVALGITGGLLLAFRVIPGFSFSHIALFTFVVAGVWIVVAALVYKEYAGALRRAISRRVLHDAELTLDDNSSLRVVEELLNRPKLSDVQLALDLLEQAEHVALGPSLVNLLDHDNSAVRVEALKRIARLQIFQALPAVEKRLQTEGDPVAKGAAVLAFCALSEVDALERVTPYLDMPEVDVQLGAMVGLLHYGGLSGIITAGVQLQALVEDRDPERRSFAARVIGDVGLNSFYQPLVPLLTDSDLHVRRSALVAASRVTHLRLIPLLIDNLANPKARSAAMAALTAGRELVLPTVSKALADETIYDVDTIRRLVRVIGQVKGAQAIRLLIRHLDHSNHELQQQVLQALHLCGYRATNEAQEQIAQALQHASREGLRFLLVQQEIEEYLTKYKDEGGACDKSLELLQSSLAQEVSRIQQRVYLLLSFLYDARAILRAAEWLSHPDSGERALALETLDVTLTSEQKKLVLPLIDESLTQAQRIDGLNKYYSLPTLDCEARLTEIIADTDTWSHDWLRTCAIYVAGKLELHELTEVIEGVVACDQELVRETAVWALTSLNGRVD
ncbi:HEAT repeat domain-containing protein [Chloroflexi bacterium TSY]|nr:HEAT repeat domain-containing protein [Chloroflexi bacterium TSY]